MPLSTVRKYSVRIADHPTSITLESAFWDRLHVVAEKRGQSVSALITEIDNVRGSANLSSAIRVFILNESLDKS